MIRFKTKGKVFDVAVTTVAGLFSVGTMIYAVLHFGLKESWPELVHGLYRRDDIAALYNYDIYIEPINEYTPYLLTEIWIRPTITYGLVACFVSETSAQDMH